jgi:TP901 family phage tail tape measure protein
MANEETMFSFNGDVSGLMKALEQATRALGKAQEALVGIGDALNTNLIRSSDKAATAVEKNLKRVEKSSNQTFEQIRKNAASNEGVGSNFNITASTPTGASPRQLARAGEAAQATVAAREAAARVEQYNASLRQSENLWKQINGEVSTVNLTISKQVQSAQALSDFKEKQIAQEKRVAEQQERQRAQEKLQAAQIAAVTKSFNLETLAPRFGIGVGSEDYKVLQLDAVAASKSLAGLRYALYDVSTSATVAGAALLGAVVIPAKAAIDLERQFADVLRTSGALGERAKLLREDFIELGQSIPIAFKDLARIGTLAGQLNVPVDVMSNFTATVAKFSATTDVSVTDSATAFGRLGELIDGVNGQYDKLGSAILAVGTNSVATESQIINTAQQIASIGNAAKMSAADVIAFSGALASLGTTPELSRGLVTRLFSDINSAIALGGRDLREYDRLVAQTGRSFSELWEADSSQALVEFFRGISNEGSRAAKTLNDIGITSVRDVPAILRLSQNIGLLEKLLSVSNNAFAEGTEINTQYGIIAETTAAKLERLGNNFTLLFATIGEGTALFKGVIDFVNSIVVGFTNLLKNPVANFFFTVAGSVTAIVGVAALLFAGLIRTTASFIAITQAMITARTQMALLGTTTVGTTGALAAESVAANSAAVSNSRLATSLVTVAGSMGVVKTALRGLLLSTGVGAILVGIGFAFEAISQSSEKAGQSASNYFGEIGTLTEAVKADTKEWYSNGDAIAVHNVSLDEGLQAVVDNRKAVEEYIGTNEDAESSINDVSTALASQDVAFGGNADSWFRDKFINNEAIQNALNDPEIAAALTKAGFSFDEFIQKGLSGEGGGGAGYVTGIIEKIRGEINAANTANDENIFTAFFGDPADGINQMQLKTISDSIGIFASETDNAREGVLGYAAAESFAALTTADFANEVELTANDIRDMTASVYEFPNAARKTGKALFDLGAKFGEGGKGAIETSDEMQNAINAILEESLTAGQGVANLTAFLSFLEEGGYASGTAVEYLESQIAALGGDAGDAVSNIDFSTFTAGLKNSGDAAGGAAAEVRTLADYASDLQTVFSRAFDLRFKKQLDMDSVTESWSNLSKEIEDAKNQLQGLTADRAQLEYFLSVAEAYGDTVRANKLRAEIASLDGDIADATANSSTELKGNSAAAINNRRRLADLVGGYQQYITSLAESGASQDVINRAISRSRQQFLDQALALGYSRDELKTYVQSFGDMKQAVNSVPRNITVDANTDPALQALNEFSAKAKRAGGRAGSAFEDALSSALSDMVVDVDTLEVKGSGGGGGGGIKFKFLKKGGYTGDGNVNDAAGIVHRGEYVMPANVVSNYGVGFFDQLAQMRNPSFAGNGGGPSAPSVTMVALSPEDRALLRGNGASGDIVIAVDSREIARANARGSKLVTAEGGYLNG